MKLTMGFFDQVGGFFKSALSPVTNAINNLTGSRIWVSAEPKASARIGYGASHDTAVRQSSYRQTFTPMTSPMPLIMSPSAGMGSDDYSTPLMIGAAAVLGFFLLK
jgi:hypothetical protein